MQQQLSADHTRARPETRTYAPFASRRLHPRVMHASHASMPEDEEVLEGLESASGQMAGVICPGVTTLSWAVPTRRGNSCCSFPLILNEPLTTASAACN